MSKCVITGKETLDKTNNISVHRDGRKVLKQLTVNTNAAIKAEILVSMEKRAEESGVPIELEETKKLIEKNATVLGVNKVLQSLISGDTIVKEQLSLLQTQGE